MVGNSGKYRLDVRLGGGGMAEVFIGSTVGAEGFSRKIAVKRVLPGYSDNPQFSQMFIAEAQISAQLVHPNIVSVLDFDRDPEGRLFLVMELVEGKDLDTLMATGLLPFPVVIFVIGEVLRGLGHAHDLPVGNDMRGIVHRDVSPHNVLLSWDGSVKVSDFGIAKARAASEATASVFIKGKPAYMSPEQANGQPLDGRSDLFAVGVMLWEMLVGRRLFTGEDTRATLAAVLFGQIPRPRTLRTDVPKDLERVVMKLLEKDLPARYATAEDAIHDLFACTDAPKSGRETLTRALAERFPQDAPVRQSRARGLASQPPIHQRGTVAGEHTPVPVSALPSLGAVMSAPTGTLDLRAPQRGPNKLLLVGGVVAAAGVAFAIVMAVTAGHKHEPPPQVAAEGSPPQQGSQQSATVARPTVPDAGMPDAPAPPDAPPPPADASVADVAAPAIKKDASSPGPAHPGPEKRLGKLSVRAFPVLTVTVDRQKIHDTPVDISLPVGKHVVHLNSEAKHEDVTVTIEANQTTTIDRE